MGKEANEAMDRAVMARFDKSFCELLMYRAINRAAMARLSSSGERSRRIRRRRPSGNAVRGGAVMTPHIPPNIPPIWRESGLVSGGT